MGAIMKMNDQDRYWPVILSEAKNLCVAREILRFTQNDRPNRVATGISPCEISPLYNGLILWYTFLCHVVLPSQNPS